MCKREHNYLYPVGYPCPVCESLGHKWRRKYIRWFEAIIDKVISVDLRECERCERLERRVECPVHKKLVWILAETETS